MKCIKRCIGELSACWLNHAYFADGIVLENNPFFCTKNKEFYPDMKRRVFTLKKSATTPPLHQTPTISRPTPPVEVLKWHLSHPSPVQSVSFTDEDNHTQLVESSSVPSLRLPFLQGTLKELGYRSSASNVMSRCYIAVCVCVPVCVVSLCGLHPCV